MQLGALAACLNLPEMQDRKLRLVGRADPRGTDAYNAQTSLLRNYGRTLTRRGAEPDLWARLRTQLPNRRPASPGRSPSPPYAGA